jgi:uncharacterized protein YdbL (DUF1318 family)
MFTCLLSLPKPRIWFLSHQSLFIACLAILLTACGGPLVGVTVVDERTALENQVLGTYQELNQQVMLVASVRYIDPKGQLKQTQELPQGKKDVVRALQRVSFNKDDLDRYKSLGIIGENNEGGITLLEPEKVQPADRAFVENLVKEENADRLAIMSRIIETNETLSPTDLPRVHKMFAALNRDKALKGERIQLDDGTWIQKDTTP